MFELESMNVFSMAVFKISFLVPVIWKFPDDVLWLGSFFIHYAEPLISPVKGENHGFFNIIFP